MTAASEEREPADRPASSAVTPNMRAAGKQPGAIRTSWPPTRPSVPNTNAAWQSGAKPCGAAKRGTGAIAGDEG